MALAMVISEGRLAAVESSKAADVGHGASVRALVGVGAAPVAAALARAGADSIGRGGIAIMGGAGRRAISSAEGRN